jgi:toxin CcdB
MIRQFDVMANPDADEAVHRPYLLVLQSDLVSGLRSTVVAPFVARPQLQGAHRLNPILVVDGQEFWLATHELFAIDQRMLRKKVTSLAEHDRTITAALDFLFTGF